MGCHRGSSSTSPEVAQFIYYYLQNQSVNAPGLTPCASFAASESACIVVATPVTTTCSDSELTRVQNGISPTNLRNSTIRDAFFSCWKKCNLLYNSLEAICTGSKFTDNKTYRNAQKSTSNTASISWTACMQKCNQGGSDEPGLQNTGATYPTPAY